MTESIAVITGGDAAYFPWLQGAVLSIREKPPGQRVKLGVFDLGCTTSQIQWLRSWVDMIVRPSWEFSFPGQEIAPTYLKGLLARPFLQKYFPGFQVYCWIDADAWVQDWSAVDLYIRGATRRGMALVPEIDRGSRCQYGGLPNYWNFAYRQYELAFGQVVASRLHSYPMLNAGIFAIAKESLHWNVWAKCLGAALQHGCNIMTDQMSLNVAVYNHGLFDKTEMLPAWCNWTCHYGLPIWDTDRDCLTEPYLPHTPIGIIHVTGDKLNIVNMKTTYGTTIKKSLRYPSRCVGNIDLHNLQ